MKIRKATQKDLTEINRIYIEGSIDEGKLQFPKITKKEMMNDLKESDRERVKNWKKGVKDRKHDWIVVEENKNIIGFGQAYIKRKDLGILESVYVDRSYRKKGVGKKINLELIKWLKKKKIKYIEIDVFLKNTPSIKLHKRLGFKPLALRMRLK